MTLDDLINSILGLSQQERFNLARASFDDIIDELEATYEEMSRYVLMLGILKVFVSADRAASEEEWRLFCYALEQDVSFDKFYEMTNGGASEEAIAFVDEHIDGFSKKGKIAACTLALCFITCDGEVTPREKALLARLVD